MHSVRTRLIALMLALDVLFKPVVVGAYVSIFRLPASTHRTVVIVSAASTIAWVVLLFWMLRPIERWRNAPGDGAVMVRAARAASLVPYAFGMTWGLYWVLLATTLTILVAPSAPLVREPPSLAFFLVAMLTGGGSLSFCLASWVLGPVAGAISLEARAKGIDINLPGWTLRRRLMALALVLTVAPTAWFSNSAYVDHVLSDARDTEQRSRSATLAAAHAFDVASRAGEPSSADLEQLVAASSSDRDAAFVADASGAILHGDRARQIIGSAAHDRCGASIEADATQRISRVLGHGRIVTCLVVGRFRVGAVATVDETSRRVFLLVLLIQLLTVALWAPLCAALLAAGTTAPLLQISRAVQAITRKGNASEVARVAVFHGDEVGALAAGSNAMIDKLESTARELDVATEELVAKQRLEKELEIGARVQTSILPSTFTIEGLEIAAAMRPATEVGGDYFDVFPVAGGGWIAIGDVAGHGLTAGLIMLMAQSVIAGLGRATPTAPPAEVLRTVNTVLYDNIRQRLDHEQHVTLSLFRYHADGRFVVAGAHEEILVWRAKQRLCEIIPTPGPWLGAVADIGRGAVDTTIRLEPGDTMLLYTDGITEARSADREHFGLERVQRILAEGHDNDVDEVRARILDEVARFRKVQEDDETVLVIRYRGATTTVTAASA